MNDEIIEFYMQVAKELCDGKEWCVSGVDAPLRRFAALIAATEREACARMCDEARAARLAEKIRERGEK